MEHTTACHNLQDESTHRSTKVTLEKSLHACPSGTVERRVIYCGLGVVMSA